MKIKHNKKRNTAFVYEALIREGTSAILQKDEQRKRVVVDIIKEHFREGSLLKQDLECYRSLYEDQNIATDTGHKIIREASLQKRLIDPSTLFEKQTDLIHDINKKLDPTVFNNFVPNYKTLATISQLFSLGISPKDRVVLEETIVNNMSATQDKPNSTESVDSLVVNSFIKKFNEKYDAELVEEQKELLSYYISSFVDNALQLKVFLNEEVSRLKDLIKEAIGGAHIGDDQEMVEKTHQILAELESYKNKEIDDNVLLVVLKTQALVREIASDGNSN